MSNQTFVLVHDQARRNAAQAVMNAPAGLRVEIKEQKRSLAQNDMMWSILTDIATQVEWVINGVQQKIPPEDWKDILTAGLKKEQRIAQGIDGGFVILGERTSKMTVKTMTDFIEFAVAFGSERGVKWRPTSLGRL